MDRKEFKAALVHKEFKGQLVKASKVGELPGIVANMGNSSAGADGSYFQQWMLKLELKRCQQFKTQAPTPSTRRHRDKLQWPDRGRYKPLMHTRQAILFLQHNAERRPGIRTLAATRTTKALSVLCPRQELRARCHKPQVIRHRQNFKRTGL